MVPLELKESETDTVGDSVPLRVEEDVCDTEVLRDLVMVDVTDVVPVLEEEMVGLTELE